MIIFEWFQRIIKLSFTLIISLLELLVLIGTQSSYQFEVIDTHTFKTAKEVVNYRDEVMTSIRDKLNFDIDGLVIKGKEIDLEDMKRARPTKQIAFKFDQMAI